MTITNASYNATIRASASTSLGFQGTWTSSDAVPTAFTLNGSQLHHLTILRHAGAVAAIRVASRRSYAMAGHPARTV